jgi:hypothetical protein
MAKIIKFIYLIILFVFLSLAITDIARKKFSFPFEFSLFILYKIIHHFSNIFVSYLFSFDNILIFFYIVESARIRTTCKIDKDCFWFLCAHVLWLQNALLVDVNVVYYSSDLEG